MQCLRSQEAVVAVKKTYAPPAQHSLGPEEMGVGWMSLPRRPADTAADAVRGSSASTVASLSSLSLPPAPPPPPAPPTTLPFSFSSGYSATRTWSTNPGR